ncbi:unnamed protein product [Aphanomyces euteiches]
MPAEFIEALIRIARKRYSGLYKKTPLSESFCLLIDNQILPYAYQSDADKFRKQVESPGIRCLLVKYLDDMKTLFAKYSLDGRDSSKKNRKQSRMTAQSLLKFVTDKNIEDFSFTNDRIMQVVGHVCQGRTLSKTELMSKEISFEAFQEAMIAMACYKFPDPYLSIENRFEKFANMYIISIKDLMLFPGDDIMFRKPQSGNWADASDEDDERAILQAQKETKSSPKESAPAPVASNAPAAASNFWASRNHRKDRPSGEDQESNARPAYDRRDGRDFGRDGRDFGRDRDGREGGRDRDGREGGRDRDGRDGGRDRDGREGGRDRFDRRDFNRSYDRHDRNYGPRNDSGYDRGNDYHHRTPVIRHQGFVTHVREDGGFGFLHCLELQQDVFFHQSEVPERESTDGEPQSHVQVGDELEFELSVNRRNGKESAVHIVRLPKGTIVLEDISEDWSTGTVTKSLPPKHKTHSRHASSELFGTIEMEATAASGRKQIVRFSAESFTGHSPRVGDEVQFHISVHRQTSAKRAVDLTITCSASSKREAAIEAALATLERETGVVQSIKGHAGFIKCLSRLQDAYFAVDKTEGIAEGDDVSFFVLPDEFNPAEEPGPASRGNTSQQRVTAMRVEKLPPGTVVFEPVVATDVEGTVLVAPPREHARHGFGGGKPSNPHRSSTGQIQGPDGQQLPVHMADVDGGYVPKEGDSVTMDIIEDRRRHMHFAVRVRCKTLNPVDREMGTIGSLKDDFGFIKCFDRAGDVYFRISDVMDVSGGIPLRLGVEASFDLVQTKGKEGLRATRVQLLPKNTIVWETEVQNQATGVLMTVPSAKYNKKEVGRLRFTSTVCPLEPYPTLREQIQTAFDVEKTEVLELKQLNPLQRAAVLSYCCLVGLDAQEKGKEIAVTKGSSAPEWSASITAHEAEADFSLDAIQDVRYEPSEGDTVACSIFLTKRGHHLVAKSIVATSTVVLTKGEGWISLVKSEGYGFIETTHGDSVFFHMSDIEQGAKVKEDDEVSFSIKIQSDKKKKAVGIAVLAPGTLPPKQIRQLEAVVSRASHRQKKKHSTAGKLKVLGESHENEDDDETRNIYAYHVEDQVVPTIVLRPGDIVTCQVRGNGRQATQVALVSSSAKSGVVEVVGVQGGTIAIADSDERVAYLNKSILNGDVALGVGDKVEFALTSPGEDKPVMATHIVRVEGPDRKVGVNSSLRRVLKESGGVATSRMAKGPDGTKGFAAGWQADVMTKTVVEL